jgi:hypothetical protein
VAVVVAFDARLEGRIGVEGDAVSSPDQFIDLALSLFVLKVMDLLLGQAGVS